MSNVFGEIDKSSTVIESNIVNYTQNLTTASSGVQSIKIVSGSINKNYWNSLNILSTDAATVGNIDLGIINNEKNLISDLKEHKFDIVYLVGQDNLEFDKKDEFIIYQGSHGDKGAESADIILPGAAYTEQDGYFTNLEGKIQKAYKASYSPGDAKEDWQIINELAEFMNNRKLFNIVFYY